MKYVTSHVFYNINLRSATCQQLLHTPDREFYALKRIWLPNIKTLMDVARFMNYMSTIHCLLATPKHDGRKRGGGQKNFVIQFLTCLMRFQIAGNTRCRDYTEIHQLNLHRGGFLYYSSHTKSSCIKCIDRCLSGGFIHTRVCICMYTVIMCFIMWEGDGKGKCMLSPVI